MTKYAGLCVSHFCTAAGDAEGLLSLSSNFLICATAQLISVGLSHSMTKVDDIVTLMFIPACQVCFDGTQVFMNVATGGFGTEVTVKTDLKMKQQLGGAAYLITGTLSCTCTLIASFFTDSVDGIMLR